MEFSSSKLVSCLDGNKKLTKYCPIQGRVVIQNVRDEDEYMDHLSKIIRRDYFPDLKEVDNLDAEVDLDTSQRLDTSHASKNEASNPEKADPTAVSLDKYMANNTTEDDASFAEIIEESEKRHRFKLSSFFPAIESFTKATVAELKPMAITGGSEVHIGPRISLDNSNSVHFNPSGVAHTPDELTDHLAKRNRISPANTRFKKPFAPNLDRRNTTKKGVFGLLSHIGLDGTESPSTLLTPQTGGFKFMDSSPSPAMSVLGASPLMTWGELAATPSRLDNTGGNTPTVVSGAPVFRIPSPSKREQLAHQLADKASRQRLRCRQEAVKRVQSGGVVSPSARLLLSPAARRLLNSSSGKLVGYRPRSGISSRPGTGPTEFANATPRCRSGKSSGTNTPRRLPSDLGVVHLRTTGKSTPVACPPISSSTCQVSAIKYRDDVDKQVSPSCNITDNLLNLTKGVHVASGGDQVDSLPSKM